MHKEEETQLKEILNWIFIIMTCFKLVYRLLQKIIASSMSNKNKLIKLL